MKLPKRVFITKVVESKETQYLLAHEDVSDLNDGVVVGIYELVEQGKLKVTRELTNVKAKKKRSRK